ncbi:MAG: hypothetical protein V9E85_13020 [Candidatus Nanopelagicales bacterium]
MKDPLMAPPEVHAEYGATEGNLANMRSAGTGPEFVLVGRKVMYRRSAIETWIAECTAKSKTAARRKRNSPAA